LTPLRTAMTGLLLSVASAALGMGAGPTGVAYPSGPTVPENLLRIELRFSAPLRTPLNIDNVKLIASDGVEIEHAFLDLPLPSADARRVTILLDPGRVKSGLAENVVLGRALHAGSKVTLVVDEPELSLPIRKTWYVTAFDANPPRPSLWTFRPPRWGTRDPLEVHLDAPLSSTAESLIAIRGPDGLRFRGAARLESGETVWRFVPARTWREGIYAVVTHPDLEDVAGNRPCGPFEAVAASRVRCEKGTAQEFEPLGRLNPRHLRPEAGNAVGAL
jgi:hypothetical protein